MTVYTLFVGICIHTYSSQTDLDLLHALAAGELSQSAWLMPFIPLGEPLLSFVRYGSQRNVISELGMPDMRLF